MADITIKAVVDGEERDVVLDDESLPDGLLSSKSIGERFVTKDRLKTAREGFKSELEKALRGRYTPDELLEDDEALGTVLPKLVTERRDTLIEALGIKDGGPDASQIEKIVAQARKPLEKELESERERAHRLMRNSLKADVLQGCRETGVVEGIDDLVELYYEQRTEWSDEWGRHVMVGDDGEPIVDVNAKDGQCPYVTIEDDLRKASDDPRRKSWFGGRQRDGSGYGGDSRPTGVRKPRSKMSSSEKSAFISEHGLEAFEQLPD